MGKGTSATSPPFLVAPRGDECAGGAAARPVGELWTLPSGKRKRARAVLCASLAESRRRDAPSAKEKRDRQRRQPRQS